MDRRSFIAASFLSTSFVLTGGASKVVGSTKKTVNIDIVYNNVTGINSSGLKKDWGFSAFIENNIGSEKKTILFDCGADGNILMHNLKKMNIAPEDIDCIFISHNHSDHIGGLDVFYRLTQKNLPVFVPSKCYKGIKSQYDNKDIIPLNQSGAFFSNFYTSGVLDGKYKGSYLPEQSLFLVIENKVILICGCSHCGVVTIVKKAKELFPDKEIDLVCGGWHLIGQQENAIINICELLKANNVKKVAPSHCTGANAITLIKRYFKDEFLELYLGDFYKDTAE